LVSARIILLGLYKFYRPKDPSGFLKSKDILKVEAADYFGRLVPSTKLHGVTLQKTINLIPTCLGASDLTYRA